MGAPHYFCGVKRWALLVFFLVPFSAFTQETPRTLLWRIGGGGLDRCSYLYGTVHSTDERAFRFGDSVTVAAAKVDVVAGELDMQEDGEEALALMDLLRMPDGKHLKDLYRRKDWRKVEAALKEHLGFRSSFVMRIKPCFVIAMLTEYDVPTERTEMLDDDLLSTARSNGQRVIGLETPEEQVKAMDVLTLEQQAAMLLDHIVHGDDSASYDDILDAYVQQDLDRLMRISMQRDGMPEALERTLIIDRNERMAERIDAIVKRGETGFFAVGAAHLPRDTGLIALLKGKGYTVDPVFSEYHGAAVVDPIDNDQH